MSRKRGASGKTEGNGECKCRYVPTTGHEPGCAALQGPDRIGPVYPGVVPMGVEHGPCTIIFGHNAGARKVLMQFSVSTASLIFDPDDARDVASKLNHFADMAEGKKAH